MRPQEQQEYRAKVLFIGGMLRGWVPARIAKLLNVRLGDYFVFYLDESGKVTVTSRKATRAEKLKASKQAARKN